MELKRICQLCDVKVTSVVQMYQHVSGKKHMLKVTQTMPEVLQHLSRLQYILDHHVDEDPVLGLEHVLEVPVGPSYSYTCLMCCAVGDLAAMYGHLVDPAHNALYIQRHHPTETVHREEFDIPFDYFKALHYAAMKIEKKFGRKKILEKPPGFDCAPLLSAPDTAVTMLSAPTKPGTSAMKEARLRERPPRNSKPLPAREEHPGHRGMGPPKHIVKRVVRSRAMDAIEEMQFRDNEEFLGFLSTFDIDDDEDASYLQRIIQNCTGALLRFREELSKAGPQQTATLSQQASASRKPEGFVPRRDSGLSGSKTAVTKRPPSPPALTPKRVPMPGVSPSSMPGGDHSPMRGVEHSALPSTRMDKKPSAVPDVNPSSMSGLNQSTIPGVNTSPMSGVNASALQGMNPYTRKGIDPPAMPGLNPSSMSGLSPSTIPGVNTSPMSGVNASAMPGMNPYTRKDIDPPAMPGVNPSSMSGLNKSATVSANTSTKSGMNLPTMPDVKTSQMSGVNPSVLPDVNPSSKLGVNPSPVSAVNPSALPGMNPSSMSGVNPSTLPGTRLGVNPPAVSGVNPFSVPGAKPSHPSTFPGLSPSRMPASKPTPSFVPNPTSNPVIDLFPKNAATDLFFNSIKNMEESDVVTAFRSIAASNPAFRAIDIPSVVAYLKATGRLKS